MDIKYKISEMFCILSKGVEFMKPLISIIMPVYNCEEFLEESILSIIKQTYTNWELIIVDDGSEDKTKEKLSQIQDKRVHVIHLKKHIGLTRAFTEGYKLAKGEFIIRNDGDDINAPTRLEIQQTYLRDNPNVGMVSCLISCFTRDQSLREDCIFIERIQNYYKSNEQIQNSVIRGFIPIVFPTLMIRKKLIDKVEFYNKDLIFDDHVKLLLELIKLCTVEKVNTILYSYRRHKKAYHVVNQLKYEEYVSTMLKDPSIRNHLKYKEFYDNFNVNSAKTQKLNENSEIRVLMMIDALNIGGTETHVLNIVQKLIDMKIYVAVATSGGPMEEIMKSYGIKIIKIPFSGDFIPNKKKFGMIKTLKTIIDEERINIIHCHLFASMQLASELYRMYKIPYVVTIHGLFYPKHIFYSTCMQASSIIAVSVPVKKMLENRLKGTVKNRIVVVPNGVSSDVISNSDTGADIRKELEIRKNSKILCYCSRLDWNKTDAARVFLFSFSRLLEEFPKLEAIIVGDGPGREVIEKEAQIINEMTNGRNVHVVGAKVNVIPYFMESSIVIGTGRVALEAMMCQKPVIAMGNQGYTGTITEQNKDSQWEMYFGDHDALENPNAARLTQDIRRLLTNPDKRKRIGRWGKTWCEEKFNTENIVKDIVQIYKKALR